MGTTMLGSTMGSLKKRTGTAVVTLVASGIHFLQSSACCTQPCEGLLCSRRAPFSAIEFAARKGAQCAFEREVEFRRGEPASTDDYLTAIADTPPTLTDATLSEFEEDIALRTRL
jgi:hypothetical protein